MNYTETLNNVTAARLNHLLWRLHLEAKRDDKKLENFKIEISEKKCEFGKWFYSEGIHIKHFEHYDKIEYLHHKVHKLYSLYLDELSKKKKKSFFSRIKKHAENEKTTDFFKKLIKVSFALITTLEKLEKLLELLVKSEKITLTNNIKKAEVKNEEVLVIDKASINDKISINDKASINDKIPINDEVSIDLEFDLNVKKSEKIKTKIEKTNVTKKSINTYKPKDITNIQDEINRVLGLS